MKSDDVKLTVLCPTYNHEKFIARALNGFIRQKTNFKFEVIVADDASTDRTQEIIREYAEKHPDLIKPLLREKNIGAIMNFQDMIKNIPTEYVALCEGDDYWTDENKLQIQVDWLDAHPEYSACFHPVRVLFEDKSKTSELNPSPVPSVHGFYNPEIDPYTKKDILLADILKSVSIPTCSLVYRWRFRNGKDLELFRTDITPRDVVNQLLHAETGPFHFIDKEMGVYYRPMDSYWSSETRSKLFDYTMRYFDFCEERYGNEFYEFLEKRRQAYFSSALFSFFSKRDIPSLCKILEYDPCGFFVAIEKNVLQPLNEAVKTLENTLTETNGECEHLKQKLKKTRHRDRIYRVLLLFAVIVILYLAIYIGME